MSPLVMQWLGVIVLGSICVVAACIAIAVLCSLAHEALDRRDNRIELRGRQRAGQRLHADAYWYSEDPPTCQLLQAIALELALDSGGGVSQQRDTWRGWRAEHDAKQRPQLTLPTMQTRGPNG